MFTFDRPVDPGLADWAGSYLNERLVGTGLGARRLTQRLLDPSLSRGETDFLTALLPVFTDLSEAAEDSDLHRRHLAAAGARPQRRRQRAEHADGHARAARDDARGAAGRARPPRRAACGSAPRTTSPRCSSLALVAAGYGLPQRNLGTVSVIGPLRMDYPRVISVVRDAAAQLSRFVAEVYDER